MWSSAADTPLHFRKEFWKAWRWKAGSACWKKGRFGHGQILGVGDLLLALSEEGELHLLELNTEEFVHLDSVQVLSGKTWNNLCIYGKRLLVRNAEEAACFELP